MKKKTVEHQSFKPGCYDFIQPDFHMIFTIAVIAAIAEQKKVHRSQRSYGNHFLAIAATTIADIELFLSQRSFSLRSLESAFHMIAIIAAIAELLFIAVTTAMVAIIWKPGFREPEKLHISAFCSPLNPGFRMIATIALIAAIAGKWFPYDRYDRCDRCGQWKVFSI